MEAGEWREFNSTYPHSPNLPYLQQTWVDGLHQVVHDPLHVPIIQEPDLGLVTFDLKDTPPVPAAVLAELGGTHTPHRQTLDGHRTHALILVERVFQLDYPAHKTRFNFQTT